MNMRSTYRVSECIELIASEIKEACERPRREAELMLMEYLGRDQVWLITHRQSEIECDDGLRHWIQRRKAHEPLEYIFNKVSFYSQTFYIAPGALIPRPETELLIDRVLENVSEDAGTTVCEVGVGSGAVSIVLARHLGAARIIGVDVSDAALAVARKNVEAFGLEERIELRHGSLLDAVPERIDVLVSNPPYIALHAELEKNLAFEPALALYGGEKGDEIIFKLIDLVLERDIPLFICEMGYDQRESIERHLRSKPFESLIFYRDLAGLDRGFVLTLKERE